MEENIGRRSGLDRSGGVQLQLRASSSIDKYPAKQHAERVAQRLNVDVGFIYLPGAPTALFPDSDQAAPLRQNRYFYYMSGVDEPDCHLTYDIGRDHLTLYIPTRSPREVVWFGQGLTFDEAYEKYDVDSVRPLSSLPGAVEKWLRLKKGTVYFLHNPYQDLMDKLHKQERADFTKLQYAMDIARVQKCPHEISLIRKANEITACAHREVLARIKHLRNESEVQAVFTEFCVAKHAKHQAYQIIAASGENASTLHYVKNDEPLKGRQLMCLDAGCEWQCYASDVTRTFPLSGSWPSEEAKNIHDLVQSMQEQCIAALQPGVHYLNVHYLAHQIAISGLLKLGILHNGTAAEIFKAGTSVAFFPHGLGHHVGLEVHDVLKLPLLTAAKDVSPMNSAADGPSCSDSDLLSRDAGALEEGMVVTIEPGIYFSRYALEKIYYPHPTHARYINRDVVERYLPVGGVRIEDDILITSNGYENLTVAPKGEEMLSIIRSGHPDHTLTPRNNHYGVAFKPRPDIAHLQSTYLGDFNNVAGPVSFLPCGSEYARTTRRSDQLGTTVDPGLSKSAPLAERTRSITEPSGSPQHTASSPKSSRGKQKALPNPTQLNQNIKARVKRYVENRVNLSEDSRTREKGISGCGPEPIAKRLDSTAVIGSGQSTQSVTSRCARNQTAELDTGYQPSVDTSTAAALRQPCVGTIKPPAISNREAEAYCMRGRLPKRDLIAASGQKQLESPEQIRTANTSMAGSQTAINKPQPRGYSVPYAPFFIDRPWETTSPSTSSLEPELGSAKQSTVPPAFARLSNRILPLPPPPTRSDSTPMPCQGPPKVPPAFSRLTDPLPPPPPSPQPSAYPGAYPHCAGQFTNAPVGRYPAFAQQPGPRQLQPLPLSVSMANLCSSFDGMNLCNNYPPSAEPPPYFGHPTAMRHGPLPYQAAGPPWVAPAWNSWAWGPHPTYPPVYHEMPSVPRKTPQVPNKPPAYRNSMADLSIRAFDSTQAAYETETVPARPGTAGDGGQADTENWYRWTYR